MSSSVDRVLERLENVRPDRGGHNARCPAHDDARNSLHVSEGQNGRALLHCHAGCSFADIIAAIGLGPSDATHATNRSTAASKNDRPFGKTVAAYDYIDEKGILLFQVARDEHKNFRQRRPTNSEPPAELWTWNVEGIRKPPYRLPEVLAAVRFKHRIYVVEGEKDADALAALGLVATTNPGGAGKWSAEQSAALNGADQVSIIPDNDEPGEKHAKAVALALRGIVRRPRILRLPNLPPKGDVSDWLLAGGTKEELERFASAGPETRGWEDASTMVTQGRIETNWIVQGVLARPSLAMVSGDADTFKSWTLTQLLIATATPQYARVRWMGRFDIAGRRAMLVTADEDRSETVRKISWLARGHGEEVAASLRGNLLVWSDDLLLDDPTTCDAFVEDIADFEPDIVVIDHLRVCFDGSEDSSEFARKIKLLGRRIHALHPCAIVWIHHWRKAAERGELNTARQRARGTGALIQSFDHHLAFTRTDLGLGVIEIDRNKKGKLLPDFCFDPRFSDHEGIAAIEYRGDAPSAAGNSQKPGFVLDWLRRAAHETLAPFHCGEIVAALEHTISKNTILRALKVLEKDRLITVEGSNKNTTYYPRETNDWNRDTAPLSTTTIPPSHDRLIETTVPPSHDRAKIL